ncbi:MAG: hypothetical protein M1165_02450 [Candidatus Pacearchaeota archaeon]|nr:hypothetical protein [Candidatus Pacearchaeota archaeon]
MAEKKKSEKESEKKIKKPAEIEKIREEIIEDINKSEQAEEKKEEEVKPGKTQVFRENKILFNVLLVMGVIVVFFIAFLIISNDSSSFTLNGVKYTLIKQGSLFFYNTKIPVTLNGSPANYNFYLQNDPRKLMSEIPFSGNLKVGQDTIININNDLACNGDGSVGALNLATLYRVIGSNVTASSNETCMNQTNSVFIDIQPANDTSISQTSPYCYKIDVSNCQILAASERYMVETFSTLAPYFNSSQ